MDDLQQKKSTKASKSRTISRNFIQSGINFIKHFWRYFRADVGENRQNFLNQFYKKNLAQIGENFSPKSARKSSLKFQARNFAPKSVHILNKKQFGELYKIEKKIAPIPARFVFSPAFERNFQNLYKIDPRGRFYKAIWGGFCT